MYRHNIFKAIAASAAIMFAGSGAMAQTYTPTPEVKKSQEEFSADRFGIFIHWGIYAVGDVSESWSFHNGAISYEDYMKQCDGGFRCQGMG